MGGMQNIRDWAALCAQDFIVAFPDGSEDRVWIRTRTQTEIEAARDAVAAVRVATKRKFAVGTDHYESLVAELDFMSPSELAELIAGAEIGSIVRQAQREVPALMPADPSRYRTEAERLKAEDKQEELEREHSELVRAKIDELTAKRQESLEAMDKDALVAMAARFAIERQILEAGHKELMTRWLYDAVRCAEDHSLPYFGTLDDVPMAETVRSAFADRLQEVDAMTPIEIRNSLGRSDTPTAPAESTQALTKESSTAGSRGSASRKKNTPGGQTAS